eukprot:GDKI01026036.1.p1 GENE.GDKI01026036.1~~GDKI01026036.1.p1  ORF type:complete len:583 (+),score=156.18 GDKI01026036.1:92-1840(+)
MGDLKKPDDYDVIETESFDVKLPHTRSKSIDMICAHTTPEVLTHFHDVAAFNDGMNPIWTAFDDRLLADDDVAHKMLATQFNARTEPSEMCSEHGMEKTNLEDLEGVGGETHILSIASIPAKVIRTQYAVRGVLTTMAWHLRQQLKEKPGSLPFDRVVAANIGNPQALGQRALTFNRQVLSCLCYPPLTDMAPNGYPRDVIDKAKRYLKSFPHIGAYSHSKGVEVFREDCVRFFEKRDGCKTDPENIILTDGASPAVHAVFELLIETHRDGVLVPVPQYPLYSATINRLGGQPVGYFLNEEKGWDLDIDELKRACIKFRQQGGSVKALVIINPGNPTAQVMSRQKMEEVIRFCQSERLVLFADEVYQDNVYGDIPFTSFRKVAHELRSPLELFSIHSSSKGLTGECGVRGGLILAHNIQEGVMEQLYKLFSVALCANTLGQAMIASILSPPQSDDPSYPLYHQERQGVYESLRRRAKMVYERLNDMEGVTCQPLNGSMYAFPRITLPPKAIVAAKEANVQPDLFYCVELLQHTGVIVVPGSGFGQRPGTWHYRITILPEEETLARVLDRISIFHRDFLKRYA